MRRTLAVVAGLTCAFFVFYTVRLLVVTSFLTHTRAGGGGAFVGIVAFPLLALVFGWIAQRSWRQPRSSPPALGDEC
jgi:uncharacterized membrane protein YjgN (DUF898 family)